MFKVLISDSVFNRIKTAEEQRTSAGHSNLYKLLNQQPLQLLTGSDTAKFKEHTEIVLDNPSSH